jgi:hypothetical protein
MRRCHPWSSALKTEEKQGNHRILDVQNVCFDIEIKRVRLKRLERMNNPDLFSGYISFQVLNHAGLQVRTVRNFLKHVPDFWTSEDWRDCLSCGEFLALDPDFFAERVVEILEGRVRKRSLDEEAKYVEDKLQEIMEAFLREVRKGLEFVSKSAS